MAPLHFLLDYPGRRRRFCWLRPISQIMYLLEPLDLDQEFFSYPHHLTDSLFACIRASAGVWTIT